MTSPPTAEAVCKRCAGTKKYMALVDCPDHEEPEADAVDKRVTYSKLFTLWGYFGTIRRVVAGQRNDPQGIRYIGGADLDAITATVDKAFEVIGGRPSDAPVEADAVAAARKHVLDAVYDYESDFTQVDAALNTLVAAARAEVPRVAELEQRAEVAEANQDLLASIVDSGGQLDQLIDRVAELEAALRSVRGLLVKVDRLGPLDGFQRDVMADATRTISRALAPST